MPRKRPEVDRKRPERAEALMEAALRHFAGRDFTAVTIKDIANSISVNSALIYYYFENKEDLFRASLEHAASVAIANYHRIAEGHDDPVVLIGDWFDNHVVSVECIRYMVKVMLDYAVAHPQREMIEGGVSAFYGFERDTLAQNIQAGIEAGLFRAVDPLAAAQVASTLLDGVVVRSQIHENYDLAGAVERLKEVFWDHLGYQRERAAE